MRVLWAPWRLSYVSTAGSDSGCILCEKPALELPGDRREGLVLKSNRYSSVLMNLYPYSNGHLMVAPRDHSADFSALDASTLAALQQDLQLAVSVLDKAYKPSGFNLGMNLGRCAGAGIDDHMHWHVVPRWEGDTNFMPVLADTKAIPEHLLASYDRLLPLFEEAQ